MNNESKPLPLGVVSGRLSSYQKLKQENKSLKEDIYNLVMYSKKEVGVVTHMRYANKFNLVNAILSGTADLPDEEFIPVGIFGNFRKNDH